MKACYYTTAWRGGEGWYAFALAQALAEAGVELCFIAAPVQPADREARHPNIDRRLLMAGTGGKGSTVYRAIMNLYRVVHSTVVLLWARLTARTFLVTHPAWLLVTFIQFCLLRLVGARIVYIVHDARPHAWSFPERFRRLEEWLLLQTYLMSAHLIVLTKSARADLIGHFGIAPDKVDVVPHGAFPSGDPGPMPGSGRLLVFGMLRRNKRIKETIEAVLALGDTLPDVKLIIAGSPHADDKAYWDECAALVARRPDRFITEIGFVEEARVTELFGMSDAILLPYEEFSSQSGVAVLASLARRPIMSTGVGGIGELIEHGLACQQVGIPVTGESIAEGIRQFYARPMEEWRSLADAGSAALGHYLSWSRIANEVKQVAAKVG